MSNQETVLQQNIRLALGQEKNLRLFRNQVGQLPDPRTGRYIQFGLAKGSSDLIGFKTIKVTPDMVGQEIAQFVSLEIKTETGKLTKMQHNWLQKVKTSGGIVGVARTVKDALKILKVS
tara:strand:+ start:34 stop:390 length:357 start_codon:yes stop_codon:yes gene_type:complete